MVKKALYLDLETAGLSPTRNGFLQIAALIEIDGKIVETYEDFVRPPDTLTIDPKALEVNKFTLQEISSFKPEHQALRDFKAMLKKHVDRFDKSDKFTVIGYNTQFDTSFIKRWFERNGDTFYGSYFSHHDVDVFGMVKLFRWLTTMDPQQSLKLINMCEMFSIDLKDAHNAMYDILATRELYYILKKELKWTI